MSKFDTRSVLPSTAAVSATIADPGAPLQMYVSDPAKPQKQDPFFAIQGIIVDAPQICLQEDGGTKISITF